VAAVRLPAHLRLCTSGAVAGVIIAAFEPSVDSLETCVLEAQDDKKSGLILQFV